MPWFEPKWVSGVEWEGVGRVLTLLSPLPLLAWLLVALWAWLVRPLEPQPPLAPFLLLTLALAAAGLTLRRWSASLERRGAPPGGRRLREPE